MMNESFDPFTGQVGGGAMGNGWGGGGGADQSFMGGGTQAVSKGNDYERLPIPVTVETLNTLDASAENVTFGQFSFTTVRVIGVITNTVESPEGKDVQYMIRDCGNHTQEPFAIFQYFGIEGADFNNFIEGTVIQAVGKIRSFDTRSSVVAFKILEVTEPGLIDVFPKEARFAELFFTKNIPERIQTGNMDVFRGTLLSTEAPESNNRQPNAGPSTPGRGTKDPQAGVSIYQGSQTARRGNNYQQERIIDFLTSNANNTEEGISTADIKAAIGGDPNFEADFENLAVNGVIFSTIDDEHWNLAI